MEYSTGYQESDGDQFYTHTQSVLRMQEQTAFIVQI